MNILGETFHSAFYDQTEIFPSKWGIWKDLITRYHLFEMILFLRGETPFMAESLRINTPLDMGKLDQTEVVSIDASQGAKGNIVLLRQACLRWEENNPKGNSEIRGQIK